MLIGCGLYREVSHFAYLLIMSSFDNIRCLRVDSMSHNNWDMRHLQSVKRNRKRSPV